MSLWSRVRSLLRAVFKRSRMESDMDAELRFHVEALAEDLVRGGVPREEALRRARIEFGGIERFKEECRGARGVNCLDNLVQDLRFGLRMLRKSPRFTAGVALTLALGIGATTAVFSIVDAVLLRSLPYKSGDRLVAVWCTELGQPGTKIFAPYRDFEEFKAASHSFEELAAVTWARAGEILSWHGSPHEVLAIPASAEFFSLLAIPAAQGRTFDPEDAANGCTVVLTDAFWKNELGAPSNIVSSTLTLNGKPCTVAGVMPRGFEFYPKQTSLWTLITTSSQFAQKPFDSDVGIFGRLKPGVTRSDAEKELAELHRRVVKESPAGSWLADIAPIVRDLREEFTWMAGRNLRTALLVLLAAVGLVLLIACLNVANLLLGRSVEREREFAVRAALGSGRSRLLTQSLVESMLLASLGAIAGVLIAIAAVCYFNSANLVELPPGNQVTINFRVLGLAIFLATLTGLLFGLAPAWQASQVDLSEVLKRSGRTSTWKGLQASKPLVMSQVALSVILLAGAGLLIESVYRLAKVPLGFLPAQVLTAQVALPPSGYTHLTHRSGFYERLVAKLDALPGVEGAALSSSLLGFEGGGSSRLSLAGRSAIENLEAVRTQPISSGYYRVLRIPLLQGRQFDSRDREGGQPVAIVNEQLVHTYFPKENPIGRQIKLGRLEDKAPWLTIVGVVGDEKRATVYKEMDYDRPDIVYLPLQQAPPLSMLLLLRAAANPLGLGPLLQGQVRQIDPDVPVYGIKTMVQRNSEFLAHPRFRAAMMGVFAALTLLLTAIGIYGVLAQSVTQRTREIGVRLALGAQSADVSALVLRQGMKMVTIGLIAGLLGAFGLTRFLSAMLYGVKPSDPLSFLAVGIVLVLAALLACYIPARKAMRVDPIVALRYE